MGKLRNYITIGLGAVAIILAALLALSVKSCTESRKETERLANNQTALLTDLESYKTEAGKNAAKVTELQMTAGEFKKLCGEQAAVIEDMGLKIKRLESVSTSVVTSYVEAKTVLRDTVYMKETVQGEQTVSELVPVKAFAWNDDWNRIEGFIDGKDVTCRYQGTDTLTIAAVKVPKKFLFFKWGCKYVEVDIRCANPSNNIVYNKTVKFIK